MTSKELFLKNKPLREQWAAVAHADWFAEVCTYARAVLMDTNALSTEFLHGAIKFEDTLRELADEDSKAQEWAKPGLVHTLDNPKPTVQSSTPEQK